MRRAFLTGRDFGALRAVEVVSVRGDVGNWSEVVLARLRLRNEKVGLRVSFGGEGMRGGGEEGGESDVSCVGGSEEKRAGESEGGGDENAMDERVENLFWGTESVVSCTMPRSSMRIRLRGSSSSWLEGRKRFGWRE